jgi:hypothetical protein
MIVDGVNAATPDTNKLFPANEIGTLSPPVAGAANIPAAPTYNKLDKLHM